MIVHGVNSKTIYAARCREDDVRGETEVVRSKDKVWCEDACSLESLGRFPFLCSRRNRVTDYLARLQNNLACIADGARDINLAKRAVLDMNPTRGSGACSTGGSHEQ